METSETTALAERRPQNGYMVREELDAREMTVSAETAATAAAAHAEASIKARYAMALRRPRDLDDVRVRFLKECSRPGFAAVALYRKPVGGGSAVEGPSIRFAEAALRCLGNVQPDTSTVYDDAQKRIIHVSVTDLETNVTYGRDVVIEKTVERRNLKDGQEPISVRRNSYGKLTYLVQATEDDLLNKEGGRVSKALRELALRLLPGDLRDEGIEQVKRTLESEASADPDSLRKKIADGFAQLGVMPSDIRAYLGHDLAQVTPAELNDLRALYNAIRDGETTWASALANHRSEGDGRKEDGASTGESRTPSLAAKVRARKAKAKAQEEETFGPPADTGNGMGDPNAEAPEPGSNG